MAVQIITETSAIIDDKIISFYPCCEAGERFLYIEELQGCEVVSWGDKIWNEIERCLPVCHNCSSPFGGKIKSAKYCSEYCRVTHTRKCKNLRTKYRLSEDKMVLSGGYYRIEREQDNPNLFSFYHRDIRKCRYRLIEFEAMSRQECILIKKYTPVNIDGVLYFLVMGEREQCLAPDDSYTSFLKISLEEGAWK